MNPVLRPLYALAGAFASDPKRVALAASGGVLYFLGFVGFDIYPLEWICFVPVLWAIRGTTPRRALFLGTVFGLATNLGGYYWVIHLLHEFAYLGYPLAALGYVLLCLYQGFLLALVVGLVRRAETALSIKPVWSLPVAFAGLELAYPLLFPSYIGNSQYRFSAITQMVDVTGMAGLTVLIGFVNGAVFEIVEGLFEKRRPSWARLAVPASAFVLALVYGLVRLSEIDAVSARARSINVAIVQTNLGARDKWADARAFITSHQEMTREVLREHPEVDLVVWPESAYNEYIPHVATSVRNAVLRGIDRPVIFGALTFSIDENGRRDSFNSAVLTSSTGGVLGIYDKIELLAFGETAPLFSTFPVLRRWLPQIPSYAFGTRYAPLSLGDLKMMVMICYEDILPSLVRMLWIKGGAPDILVNVTNDSWYGDTHEPLIHLVLASFRSIETRRALVRSTNTGISAVIDPAGRIAARTQQWRRESLVARVPVITGGAPTLFVQIGDVVGWTSLMLTAIGLIESRRRRRAEVSHSREEASTG